MFIHIVEDCSVKQLFNLPIGEARVEPHNAYNDLKDGEPPKIKIGEEVCEDSDEAAEGRDGKVTKCQDLDERVLGDSLGVSILSSVEEKEIGHVSRETTKVQEGSGLV